MKSPRVKRSPRAKGSAPPGAGMRRENKREGGKRRVAEGKDSEAWFHAFMDKSPGITWIKDARGRHVYASKTFEKRLHTRPGAWMGKTLAEIFPRAIARRLRKNDLAVLRDGRTRHVVEEATDPNGARSTWMVSKFLIRDTAGRKFVAGIGFDITRRKHAEQDLFESRQRLQAFMDAVPVGVSFSHDAQCQHITGNPAFRAQFEITAKDNVSASATDPRAVGRRVRYLRDGRKVAARDLPLQRAMAENRVVPPVEVEVILPSGRRWIAEASAAPVRDRDGRVAGGIAVSTDITGRKRMEEELRQLNAGLEERVAARTEELRRLADRLASIQDDEQRRVAGELHDSVAQLLVATRHRLAELRALVQGNAKATAILNDLDQFVGGAQAATRDLTFELDPISLARAGLDTALRELCVHMSARHKMHFAFDSRGEPGRPPKGSATVLFKAVRELMFNVVRHAGVRRATVRALWGPAGCRLVVEDGGRGFDPAAPRGHGLVGIAERMRGIGGRVAVASAPRKGTRVSLTLPYR